MIGVGCAMVACTGGRDTRSVVSPAPADEAAHQAPAGDALAPARAPMTEAAARSLLAERFRAAGFRVRYDVLVDRAGLYAVTLDGYDPEAEVGFEYIAEEERDTDIIAGERAALARDGARRVLVLDAM